MSEHIAEAQTSLRGLMEYIYTNHDHIDLLRLQLLASKVAVALEAAERETGQNVVQFPKTEQ